MTFTYDLASADPVIARLSRVRLLIGDTVENAGVLPSGANLQDEEITALITAEQGVGGGAAAAMELISTRYANAVDVRSGDVSKSQSQIAKSWSQRAAAQRSSNLRTYLAATGGGSAGLSVNVTYESSTDDRRTESGL